MKPVSQNIVSTEQAKAMLFQWGAIFYKKENNSHIYSTSAYWIRVTGIGRGQMKLEFFKDCPCNGS